MSSVNMKYILLSTIYLLSQPRITLLESKAQPTLVIARSSRPKLSGLYTLSQNKLLESHINLHSGSYMYLYSIYGITSPPPPRGKYVLLYVTYLFSEYSCSS